MAKKKLASAVSAALKFTAIATAAVAAQASPEADRTFVIQLVDLDPTDAARVEARTIQGRVTASVDGLLCATADASESPPSALVLGLPDQPEECQREGATVLIHNSVGQQLVEQFTFRAGEAVELGNYAPSPFDTGPGPAVTGTGIDQHGSRSSWVQGISISALGLSVLGLGLLMAARRSTRGRA